MRLTDGKVTAKAMEFKPLLKSLPAIVPPGTKVVVSNASVKAGVILLDDRSFQVRLLVVLVGLGGQEPHPWGPLL